MQNQKLGNRKNKSRVSLPSQSRKDLNMVMTLDLEQTGSGVSKKPKKSLTDSKAKIRKTLSLNTNSELPPIFPRKSSTNIPKEDNSFITKPKRFSTKQLSQKIDINSQYLNSVSTSCNLQNSNDFRKSSISNTSSKLMPQTTKVPTNRKNSNMFLTKQLTLNLDKQTNLENNNNIIQLTAPNNGRKNKKIFLRSNTVEGLPKQKENNRKSSANSSNSISEEDNLKSTQQSIRFQGFAVTQPGKIEDGSIKTNQDSFVILQRIFNIDFNIFSVMDGHGTNGHLVSQFSKQCAMEYFQRESNYLKKTRTNYSLVIDEAIVLKKLRHNGFAFIKSFFNKTDTDLSSQKFDVHFSGTTCVILFQIGTKLICANAGDSRCILVRSSPSEAVEFEYENLSNDHKPYLEGEKKRIEESGGVVEKYREANGELDGPYRVWVKGEEFPGLAVSRSLGDSIAENVGVVSDPEIIVKDIDSSARYVVLASDGVWDFLDGEDIIRIVSPFYKKNDPNGAASEIVKEATSLWEKDGIERDDITVIVSFVGETSKKTLLKKATY